jgi:3-oxoacyl-[acyl-carrier-protein] synthase-1
MKAIRRVFGNEPKFPISSTKALTGHGLSYAGILESALSIRALRADFVPGTANLEDPDQEARGLLLPKNNLDIKAKRFISNSSGFGGANVSLAFEVQS